MSAIRLYDTATKNKVELRPLQAPQVGVYVCGPTVYDQCHIGHARCYIAFDVIVRHLRHRGLTVTYVRNVTDIDDKIIQRATELGEPPLELSARFTHEFHADMESLGNQPPDHEPKVSDHLDEIIQMVAQLIEQGHAYAVDGDVYFSVPSYAAYGALSARNLDDLQSGARVEVDQRKRNPLDFALWKTAKPGEPAWDSPWGPGRPGWHIECSAMSRRFLGDAFDIHGGGMDLIFPHHENEMTQSKACCGETSFARHWMHNGFVNVRTTGGDEEKMSKSLGNFFTVRQVCTLHEAEALRLYLLGTQYRKPVTFEIERTDASVRFPGLEDAERRLSYGYRTRHRLHTALASGKPAPDRGEADQGEAGQGEVMPPADDFTDRFIAALDDDFNTAAALGQVSDLFTLANRLLDSPKSAPKDVRRRTLQRIQAALDEVDQALGLWGQNPAEFLGRRRAKLCQTRNIEPTEVDQQLAQRAEARKAKDFARADAIRQALSAQGIEFMDHPDGSTSWTVSDD